MSEKRYLVVFSNGNFGFNDEKLDEATNYLISEEAYEKFFDLQSQGKQYRLKTTPSGTELFDYIEEYIPQPANNVPLSNTNTTNIIENLQNQIASLKETIVSQNEAMETQSKIVNELVLAKLKTI